MAGGLVKATVAACVLSLGFGVWITRLGAKQNIREPELVEKEKVKAEKTRQFYGSKMQLKERIQDAEKIKR